MTSLIKSIQTQNCSKQHSYGYLTDSGTSTLKRHTELASELCYNYRKAHHKLNVLVTNPIIFDSHYHTYISLTEKNTHHTTFTAVDIRKKKYRYSFHLTHSTNWLTRYKTHLVFQIWMSFECKKHSYFICYHCSLHTLSPKPQD